MGRHQGQESRDGRVEAIVYAILIIIALAMVIQTKSTYKDLKEHPYKVLIDNQINYVETISDEGLHLASLDENHHSGGLGYFQGELGVESYYNLNYAAPDIIINTMRDLGYSEEEYPFWLREDGVYMLGDYVMCCTDDEYKYGDIISTSLGEGIVCDHASFGTYIKHEEWGIDGTYVLDVYTDWNY